MADTNTRLTLWGIEVFIAVAEEGAVSAAARRLGASPSAVSQQITNLEDALGATLINRAARPLTLTPAGHMFRRRAQTILNEAAQAKAELALADLSCLTDFRLGVIEDLDAEVTPRLLASMAEELRGCQFLLETGASHRLHDALENRVLDMVVTADMGATAEWMEIHPLLEEPFVTVVPADHSGRLEDLQTLPFIQYSSRYYMGRQIASHLARQNMRLPHRFELDSYNAILAMVAEGAGWTILTPLGALYSQRFQGRISILPLSITPLSRTITLSARAEVLGDMPLRIAKLLRLLLKDHIVDPALTQMSWLKQSLKVL